MSAVTRSSRDTIQPANLTWVKLLTIANDIFRWKGVITDILKASGESAWDWKTPSQIMKVLKQANLYIELSELKGLLREFGF